MSRQTHHLLDNNPFDETFEDSLEDMKVLAIADYVIVSHEYYTLIKKRLNFAYDRSQKTNGNSDVYYKTAMLFILSDLLEREETIS